VDEGRKRVIGIMASILAARKVTQQDSTRPSPAVNSAIDDTVKFAERILRTIGLKKGLYAAFLLCLTLAHLAR
jgi:hypothetical protein